MRIAIRYLLKAPGYTAGAIATLALTIGASSAMFGAVYAVLLQPVSIRHPGNLVIAWERDAARNQDVVELSYRNFQDWAASSRSFSQVAALGSSTWPAVLDRPGESIGVSHAGVTASFFETLGVVPEIGRGLRPADDEPGAPRVVVLSHRFWVSRFGADPHVVGTTIEIHPAHIVVGVMPEGFEFPRGTDYWTPVVPILASSAGTWHVDTLERVGVLFVIGRLRDGVTPALANEELDRLAARLQREGGAYRFGSTVVVTPLIDYMLGPVRPALWALLAAVGVLSLIGCANVSGLMLTRVAVRSREQAIRLALGASRRHLGTHWACETLIVASAGGLLGLLCSQWMTQTIAALAPEDVPRLSDISINLPVAAFTLVAVLAAAVLCGAAPIGRASRSNPAHALGDGPRGTSDRQSARARSLLLIVQMALTVVLLVAAGLVVRSFVNLRRIDLGFRASNVLTLHVSPRHPQPSANEWVRTLLQRVSALPDVEQAGAVYLRPLAHGPIGQETSVILEGQPLDESSARRNPNLNYQVATPGYFSTMGIPLRRGRMFDTTDVASARRVVVIGESAARRLWPGTDAVGQRLLMATQETDGSAAWRTVVGVVGDVKYRGIDDVRLDVYDPALQSPLTAGDVVIRTSGDPMRLVAPVLAAARALDKTVVVDGITTMDAIVARVLAPWRFSVWLFMMFAALAFVLATVGLVSLITLDVANRRHELAVRLALGAAPADVVRSVLFSAGWRVVAGMAIGVPAALTGTRAMRSFLVGVGTADAPTYAAVIALVSAVVAVAAYLPARRAAAIDPMALLRRG